MEYTIESIRDIVTNYDELKDQVQKCLSVIIDNHRINVPLFYVGSSSGDIHVIYEYAYWDESYQNSFVMPFATLSMTDDELHEYAKNTQHTSVYLGKVSNCGK